MNDPAQAAAALTEALIEAESLISTLEPQVGLHVRRNMAALLGAHAARARQALGGQPHAD